LEDVARIQLPDVALAVRSTGEGPVVLAAHGFPDEPGTFDAQVPALVAAGFRVVAPTMRGYAPSGVPESGRYDLRALGADLLALADRYSPRAPVRILGHDWGAAAGYAASAMAPERVSHLAALAVPHLRAFLGGATSPAQVGRSWYMLFFQARGLADAAVAARDLALLERLWRAWSPGYRPSAAEMAAVKDAIRGRIGPVLGYYRALPRTLASSDARRLLLAPTLPSTLRLHGADDGCVGAEIGVDERRWHAGPFASAIVPGAGHFLHRERPEAVNRRLVAFFREPGSAPARPSAST
jgi:pimeloyl-ACP methyl ester carboxylesterase